MACNGNANETCGGPNGLSVFQLTGWYSAGCWNDTVGSRTLRYEQYGLNGNSIEICTAACAKAGYAYAGMEYGESLFSSIEARIC
jgi:hypothetical protein